MCYYSKTLHASQFRNAKEGEDLTIKSDHSGHHYAASPEDGKIVCILPSTQVHFEKLELDPQYARQVTRDAQTQGIWLSAFIGQPISATFYERPMNGYSADHITLRAGHRFFNLHLIFIKEGTKFYIGPKRPDVAGLTGVDDPSIALDHRTDVAPTHGETVAKLEPVSIRR